MTFRQFGTRLYFFALVAAAAIEPCRDWNPNLVMALRFLATRGTRLERSVLEAIFLGQLESTVIHPCLGDILETQGPASASLMIVGK